MQLLLNVWEGVWGRKSWSEAVKIFQNGQTFGDSALTSSKKQKSGSKLDSLLQVRSLTRMLSAPNPCCLLFSWRDKVYSISS